MEIVVDTLEGDPIDDDPFGASVELPAKVQSNTVDPMDDDAVEVLVEVNTDG